MSIKVNALPVESNPALTDYTINDSANITTKRSTWQKILNLFIASGITLSSVKDNITSAGTNLATATGLTKQYNRVDNVAPGTGVGEIITPAIGGFRMVQNNGLNNLLWYPTGTGTFYLTDGTGALGLGVPISIAPGNSAAYISYTNDVLTLLS